MHTGENATVEIVIDDDYWIILDFTGDMERQTFCSSFIDFIDGNDEDSDDDKGKNEEDEDSDEGAKKETSDNEELNIKIYD